MKNNILSKLVFVIGLAIITAAAVETVNHVIDYRKEVKFSGGSSEGCPAFDVALS